MNKQKRYEYANDEKKMNSKKNHKQNKLNDLPAAVLTHLTSHI